MSVKQIARMTEWLEAKGHSPQEIIDCIRYIANQNPNPKDQKKKSGSHIAKKPD